MALYQYPAITIDLLEQLETAGPFGAGASRAEVCNSIYANVAFAKRAGETHLKTQDLWMILAVSIDAIAFGAFKSDLGEDFSKP